MATANPSKKTTKAQASKKEESCSKTSKIQRNGCSQETMHFEDACCMTKPTKQPTNDKVKSVESTNGTKATNKGSKIVVKCDCGFSNTLYIRGEGVTELSWDKGTPMKNIKADEWVWETSKPFNKAQFKILLNDMQYEVGENHQLDCGKQVQIIPNF